MTTTQECERCRAATDDPALFWGAQMHGTQPHKPHNGIGVVCYGAFYPARLNQAKRSGRGQALHQELRDQVRPYLTEMGAVLSKVIEHHAPASHTSGGPGCTGCDNGAYAEDDPEWPCSTIILIAREMGAWS